jgi:PAS domain S-box-containing protein
MADAPLDTGTTSPASRRRPLLITLAAFAAIVVIVGSVTYAVYRQQLKAVKNKTADQLVSIGALKASQISAWLDERRGDANTLRANEPIERLTAQWLAHPGRPLPANVRSYFAALRAYYHYASIAVFDRYGRQRWSAAGKTGDDGPYVVEAVDGALAWGRTVFVDLHQSASGLPALGYAVPIDVAHGGSPAPFGAVYLQDDPARFPYPLVQRWPVPSGTAETLIVRRDGDMITYLDSVRGRPNAPLTLSIPITDLGLPAVKAVSGVTGIVEGVDYRGAKVLADLRPVPGTRSSFRNTQWYIVAKEDLSEIYGGAGRRAATAIGVMVAVIAIAALGVLLFWRSRESRSLQALYASERERRALGQHYEYVTRYANDIMLLFAVDGAEMRVVDANERATQAYGCSIEELRTMTLRDLRSETAPIGYEESLDLVRAQGAAVFESEHRRRDGSVFPVEHSARLMEIEGRQYIQGIARDITERKQAESAVQESEQRYRSLFDHMTSGFGLHEIVVDDEGLPVDYVFLEVNAAFEEATGLRAHDVIGRRATEVIAGLEDTGLIETYGVVALGAGATRFEQHVPELGRTYDITVYSPEAGRFATILTNVTQRKLTEQELRHERDFEAAVMDTAGALICVLDPQGRIVAFNHACEETTGYTFDELLNEPVWERLIPSAEVEGVKAVFADLTAGVLPSHFVNNWAAKDGSHHLIEWSNTIVAGVDGEIEHVIGTGIDVTERRRAEAQLGAFFTHSPTGMAILDDQLRYIHINEGLAEMNGIPAEDHLGRSLAEVLPELAPTVEPMFRRILDSGVEMRGVEVSGETPMAPGVLRHWLASYFPIRGPHGRADYLGLSVVEVTDRRLAEERVIRLSRLYRVLSAVNEAIVRVHDPQTMYTEMCRVLVETGEFSMAWVGLVDASRHVVPVAMAGHTGDYLDRIKITVDRRRTAHGPTGRAIISSSVQVCPDIAADPGMKSWRQAALRHGFHSSAALPLRCGEELLGALNIYSDRVGALEDEDIRLLTQLADDVSFALEINRGETERRPAVEALRDSEQMLAEAQRLGHVGSWRYDMSSGELLWSAEQYRIFGLDPGRFVPTVAAVAEFVHPDDRGTIAMIDELPTQVQPKEWAEMRIVRPDGEIRHITTRVAIICADDGSPREMVGTTIDVTDRRAMEDDVRALNADLEQRVQQRTAQLRSANEELEAFAYSVSHDLRAPLRALDGFSLALLEDYSDVLDETAQDYLSRVRGASQRMGALIDDLLSLSRVTRREVELADVDLSHLARRVVQRLREAESERAVAVTIADGLHARADVGLLEVALENLLNNAWKFTSKVENAHIEFAADGEGADTVYHVRDDGAGFDPTYVGKLFAPFQRLHTVSEFPGNGIGLATVQRIIHRHGGRCWAEGKPGAGATVYFTLAPEIGHEREDPQ